VLANSKALLTSTVLELVNSNIVLTNMKALLINMKALLINTKALLINTKALLINTKALLINTKALLINTKALLINTKALLINTEFEIHDFWTNFVLFLDKSAINQRREGFSVVGISYTPAPRTSLRPARPSQSARPNQFKRRAAFVGIMPPALPPACRPDTRHGIPAPPDADTGPGQ
jgi:hypothetical protein